MYEIMIFASNTATISIDLLFFWFLIIRIKNIKRKQVVFFVGLLIAYIVAAVLTSFNYTYHMYFYLVFNIIAFIALKFTYRKECYLTDFLLIGYIGFLLTLINLFFTILWRNGITNYVATACLIEIITIVIILVISNIRINEYYDKLLKLWDRRDDGKIKAITVRNSIIVIMNIGLYVTSILLYALVVR